MENMEMSYALLNDTVLYHEVIPCFVANTFEACYRYILT
jgi:hypothetical protein